MTGTGVDVPSEAAFSVDVPEGDVIAAAKSPDVAVAGGSSPDEGKPEGEGAKLDSSRLSAAFGAALGAVSDEDARAAGEAGGDVEIDVGSAGAGAGDLSHQ